MPKITCVVDQETCIGCGVCANTSPDHFELDETPKSHFKDGDKDQVVEVNDSDLADIKTAADQCPVAAITVEDK
ncbi:putative 4Fe-4S single cluster domain [Monocercomonoides exilis]|uniref:putative 4Fe-4S single cluster domain n=1 Tax=Monocercomonoides exilis TaxID=2049356 RepID=UPI00355975A8|nr:putative 4Fe-4S single cluster domain [Monocercomonoides exilis]